MQPTHPGPSSEHRSPFGAARGPMALAPHLLVSPKPLRAPNHPKPHSVRYPKRTLPDPLYPRQGSEAGRLRGACVRRITSAVLSAAVFGMPGGRVFSCNRPTTPATMNRSCQRQTQVAGLPVADMIALVPVPSADKSTIRARQTCFCGEDGAEMIAARRRRSPGDTINPIPVRISLNRASGNTTESKFGLLRSGQSTRGVLEFDTRACLYSFESNLKGAQFLSLTAYCYASSSRFRDF